MELEASFFVPTVLLTVIPYFGKAPIIYSKISTIILGRSVEKI